MVAMPSCELRSSYALRILVSLMERPATNFTITLALPTGLPSGLVTWMVSLVLSAARAGTKSSGDRARSSVHNLGMTRLSYIGQKETLRGDGLGGEVAAAYGAFHSGGPAG